jgi:hypothetical protein
MASFKMRIVGRGHTKTKVRGMRYELHIGVGFSSDVRQFCRENIGIYKCSLESLRVNGHFCGVTQDPDFIVRIWDTV